MGDGRESSDEYGVSNEEDTMAYLGAFPAKVRIVEDAAEETLLLWAFRNPVIAKQNSFVSQGSLHLKLDACGQLLHIMQAPSSVNTPGVTGGVMWDSGVVLAKLLEHAADTYNIQIEGKKFIELGAGCGLTGCVAALLGATVILTDVDDRLRLLQKNVDENSHSLSGFGSASVRELTWGNQLEQDFIDPLPDFDQVSRELKSGFMAADLVPAFAVGESNSDSSLVLNSGIDFTLVKVKDTEVYVLDAVGPVVASDVIYNEDVVPQLLDTLRGLTGPKTTVLLAGELRNDAVLECFFELALVDFTIGRVLEADLHPAFCSPRVAVYVLVRKPKMRLTDDNPWTNRLAS